MARIRRRNVAREQRWRKTLTDWKASGLSVSAFCRAREVRVSSFYYWRRELALRDHCVGRSAATVATAAPAFVPVRVVTVQPIEVVVRSGQTLQVGPGFDAAHLRAVVAALEAA